MNTQLSLNPRLVLLNHILYVITSLLVFFIIFNFYEQRFFLALAELFILVINLILLVKFQEIFSSKYSTSLTVGYSVFMIISWTVAAIIQPIQEMFFLWCFAILVASYAVNGSKRGFKISSVLLIITISVCHFKLFTNEIDMPLVTWLNTLLPALAIWFVVHKYECNNHKTASELSKLATHDTLTGLKDRHQVYKVYKEHSNQIHSLILLDIVGLSKINEQYGYLAGDVVLINVAKILQQEKFSSICQPFRIDGDEFAMLLPNTDCQVSRGIAKVLTHEITEYKTVFKYNTIQVTVSIGIACLESDGHNFDELLKKTNLELLQSKSSVESETCTSC